MALGRNLKRQQLIPGQERDQDAKAKVKTESMAAPKKKAPKKAPAKKAVKKKAPPVPKGVVTKKPTKPQEKEVLKQEIPIASTPTAAPVIEEQEAALPSHTVDPLLEQPVTQAAPPMVEPASVVAPQPQMPESIPAPAAPVYEVPRTTYINRQEMTMVSQREYEKRLRLKEKFDNEIKALKGNKLLLIVFKLGVQEFAIEINKTKEVVKTPDISPMPHLPEHMIGVANVRGRVVLIMDLGRKFHLTDGVNKWEDPYSIVIQNSGYKIGLLVPEVPNTMMVDGSNISTAAAIVTDTARDETYIKGIIKEEGRMIFFLDIEELVEGNKVSVVPDEAAV